jgi:FlaG/FlaF family flagellin (archaellin)
MVAITVILAAVIGAFVFGMGGNIAPSLDLHFSGIEAHVAAVGYLTMTASGTDSIAIAAAGAPTVGPMTELIVVVELNGANDVVTGLAFAPADLRLDAGSRLTVTATTAFITGDDIHVVVTDPGTGTILVDTTVKATT